VRELDLVQYAQLVDQPGFIQVLTSISDDLKVGRVRPESFAETVFALALRVNSDILDS
jgi:hypothetical protein